MSEMSNSSKINLNQKINSFNSSKLKLMRGSFQKRDKSPESNIYKDNFTVGAATFANYV